jgi:uncharacterized protein YjbI with pentapeptide repeats
MTSADRDFQPFSRAGEAIPVVTRDPVSAFTIPWQIRPPRPSRTVVVKATCDLVADSPAVLRGAPDLPSGDVHAKGDPQRSLLYPSDFAVWKPRADVVLSGHAHAPDGRATCMDVAFRFGRLPDAIARTVRVFGERRWIGRTASAPRPFERVALVHENAFGGPGIAANPAGTGARPAAGAPWLLPQLEDPSHLIATPEDAPAPVGFGAIPAAWPARWSRLGTYDEVWRKTRWPYFPADFDWLSQQAAPPSQQLDAVRGDEPFEIVGMRPDRRTLRGRLPGVRARAFVDAASGGRGFFEVRLRLDTVVFDMDACKLHLVWRGLFEVADERASEVTAVLAMLEDLSAAPKSKAEAHALYTVAAAPHAPALWQAPAANDGDANEADARGAGTERSSEPPRSSESRSSESRSSESRGSESRSAESCGSGPPRSSESAPPPASGTTRKAPRPFAGSLENLAGADLTGADLAGRDLRGVSLAGAILADASLAGARLEGADLSGAQLAGADLRGACLARADLRDADLSGADLSDADLAGARLDGARLDGATAARADFTGAAGTRVSFAHAALGEARFAQATLPSADFTSAALDGARFDHALLDGVRFYDARGERVSFESARLDGARADGARFEGASFRGASAEGSIWDRATLRGSLLFGARLRRASFAGATCEGAVFSRADLAEADFARARLGGASMLRTQAMLAIFENADLTSADLRGACLHGAETRGARLQSARLELAIVTATKLEKSA